MLPERNLAAKVETLGDDCFFGGLAMVAPYKHRDSLTDSVIYGTEKARWLRSTTLPAVRLEPQPMSYGTIS